MTHKVLCVDDDENVLAAYQRQLRQQFQVATALGGESGLELLERGGPFTVVVSDLRMPGMDGIQFLSKVKERAPDTVRMVLTGNGDLQAAMDAVNEGNIFRFLTKPCPPELFTRALADGIRQYRLTTAERGLLDNTLKGSVRVITEILSIVDSRSFGRAEMLRELTQIVLERMGIQHSWELDVAAMLSQLGMMTIPPTVVTKARAGHPLASFEKEMLARVPEIGRKLLENIPRLEPVAQIVFYQNKHLDGTGFPPDSAAGESIPEGARILKVLIDLLEIESMGIPRPKALYHMRKRAGWYDPAVLDAVADCLVTRAGTPAPAAEPCRTVALKDLKPGDVLVADMETTEGLSVLSAGHKISDTHLARIHNIAQVATIQEPILVKGT